MNRKDEKLYSDGYSSIMIGSLCNKEYVTNFSPLSLKDTKVTTQNQTMLIFGSINFYSAVNNDRHDSKRSHWSVQIVKTI
jgi:hypothetical protein